MDKRKAILIALPFLILMTISTVLATETLEKPYMVTPTNSSTVSGAYTLNCSVDEPYGTSNASLYNITYEAYSGATANSSWTTICSLVNINISENEDKDVKYNCSNFGGSSFQTNLADSGIQSVYEVEDASDYYVRVTIVQGDDSSNTETSNAVSGVTIDYTVPTAPTSLQPGDGAVWNESGDLRMNATVVGSNTTNCTLMWGDTTPTGNKIDVMTHSGNTCYISLTDMPDGVYTYQINASDGLNSSATGTKTLTIDTVQASPFAKAYVLEEDGTPIDGKLPSNTARNIALIAIIGVFIYIAANRNKKF